MTEALAIDTDPGRRAPARPWIGAAVWMLVLLLFAAQWYTYDATRHDASPYLYYVGWSLFLWALSPLVLRFAARHPIGMQNWRRAIPLHLAVSIGLSVAQVMIEASIGWLRERHGLAFSAALNHYFVQHVQLYLATYWALVAAAQFYRLYDESRSRQLRAARLEVQLSAARLASLRSQLQPHFLFNTLNTAVGLIHEDPAGTEEILLRLSQLLRASLGDLQSNEIPLRKELEFIDCYVGIQQRRFGERLCVERQVEHALLDHAVPSLILQPLVENAIRHGIGTHKENDTITIKAYLQEGRMVLEVCNFRSSLEGAPEALLSRGVGLANTRARLHELYGAGQSMQISNLKPRGVSVRLAFPAQPASR